MSESVKLEDLVVGERYHVRLSDCCVTGDFTAILRSKSDDRMVFDNGVSLEIFGGEGQTGFERVP